MKKYTFWIKTAAVFMLITATVHVPSLFIKPEPQNETERQLAELMTNYKIDFGAGFKPSSSNLVTALSSCFSLLCLLGGLLFFYLGRKIPTRESGKGF